MGAVLEDDDIGEEWVVDLIDGDDLAPHGGKFFLTNDGRDVDMGDADLEIIVGASEGGAKEEEAEKENGGDFHGGEKMERSGRREA